MTEIWLVIALGIPVALVALIDAARVLLFGGYSIFTPPEVIYANVAFQMTKAVTDHIERRKQ